MQAIVKLQHEAREYWVGPFESPGHANNWLESKQLEASENVSILSPSTYEDLIAGAVTLDENSDPIAAAEAETS